MAKKTTKKTGAACNCATGRVGKSTRKCSAAQLAECPGEGTPQRAAPDACERGLSACKKTVAQYDQLCAACAKRMDQIRGAAGEIRGLELKTKNLVTATKTLWALNAIETSLAPADASLARLTSARAAVAADLEETWRSIHLLEMWRSGAICHPGETACCIQIPELVDPARPGLGVQIPMPDSLDAEIAALKAKHRIP